MWSSRNSPLTSWIQHGRRIGLSPRRGIAPSQRPLASGVFQEKPHGVKSLGPNLKSCLIGVGGRVNPSCPSEVPCGRTQSDSTHGSAAPIVVISTVAHEHRYVDNPPRDEVSGHHEVADPQQGRFRTPIFRVVEDQLWSIDPDPAGALRSPNQC